MPKRDGRLSRSFRTYAWREWPYCQWCGNPITWDETTTDHIVPLDRGGSNGIHNLCLSCVPCNHGRGNQLIDRPLIGPRWSWPRDRREQAQRVYVLLPLTREPVMRRYRRRTPGNEARWPDVTAFPITTPLSSRHPLAGGTVIECSNFNTGDMLVFGATQLNGDPLVYLQNKHAFLRDYEPLIDVRAGDPVVSAPATEELVFEEEDKPCRCVDTATLPLP